MQLIEVTVLFASFLLLLGIGVPVCFSIGLSTMLIMVMSIDTLPALATVVQRMATGLDSFALLAIPFFILVGQLMNHGGIARRLVDCAKVFVGRFPGGLAFVNIIAAMFFGAISGSAVASASAIGGFMTERMQREGYDRNFGAAVNISASTTGMIIPPSNTLIVYSFASGGTSIAALFLAGYIPGLLVGCSLMVVAAVHSLKHKYPVSEGLGILESMRKCIDAIPSLLLIVVVMGGIIAGFFTATEASAVAVLYTLFLSVVVYREVAVRDLPKILLESAVTTSVVMFLIGTSIAMSWLMAYTNIPQNVTAALMGFSEHPLTILLMINAILLFVGIFMDMTPAILIFTPMFLPVAQSLGIHPVQFGIMLVLNLGIGLCTPPVGTVLFVGCGVAGTTIEKVIRPLIPMFVAMLISLMAVSYFSELSLWLPQLFGVIE